MTGQQTPADIAADRAWRDCGHRADYASAAEHDRDCPAHGIDAQPAAADVAAVPGQPVHIFTRDASLAARLRDLAPEVPAVVIREPRAARVYWSAAPAVLIGADMLREVCAVNPPTRAGVYVITTPDSPLYLPRVCAAPGDVVELSQPDAPEWLAARLRHLAAGGDPGNPPDGCDACGAAPGEECRDPFCQGTWH